MSTRVLSDPAQESRPSWSPSADLAQPSRLPWLERWHLLSLDAPTVATVWTWFLARSAGVHLAGAALTQAKATLLAMFLAVWILYAADRLLDARAAARGRESLLEARHRFHARHAALFVAGLVAASLLLTAVLLRMPRPVLREYIALALALTAWLAAVHGSSRPARLPKELAVALFFAVATALPAFYRGAARGWLFSVTLCFALTCAANCFFLLRWESMRRALPMHPSAAVALRLLQRLAPALLVACAATGLALAPLGTRSFPPLACAISVAALLVLDRFRQSLAATTLRALGDAALLSPLAFAWLLRTGAR